MLAWYSDRSVSFRRNAGFKNHLEKNLRVNNTQKNIVGLKEIIRKHGYFQLQNHRSKKNQTETQMTRCPPTDPNWKAGRKLHSYEIV